MNKKVLAVRHVKIEHAGLIEDILKEKGIEIDYVDTAKGQTLKEPLENYSFAIVLGGYMGAYEESLYPFLSYEYKLMEEVLKRDIPLLGICLGSQMLAKVLGARVYKGEKGKEIGFFDVYKVSQVELFKDFPDKLKVFQWHGDTFDLPKGAHRVFEGDVYKNQGFIYKNAIGLQFHIEVSSQMVEEWLSVYNDEVEKEGLDREKIIQDTKIYIPILKEKLESLLDSIINYI